MTKNAALMVAPTNEVLNKESPQAEAGIKEDDLYGDWLVVTRKKNQGRKSSPKNQATNMRANGDSGKKFNGKGLFFSHLNEAGKQFGEENENLRVAPQFHPGGGVDNNKVWTKRNKRARGMSSRSKEPNENERMSQPRQPIMIQTRQSSLQLERQGRVGPPTKSLVFGEKVFSEISGKEGNFEAFMNSGKRSSNGDEHLKPPEPNDAAQKQPCVVRQLETEDEMVVETPPSRQ
jgi:hypothetical protein